jgi:hypothetical protein
MTHISSLPIPVTLRGKSLHNGSAGKGIKRRMESWRAQSCRFFWRKEEEPYIDLYAFVEMT